MTLAQRLTELPPSLRWRLSAFTSQTLYARSFASFGQGSVIVKPLILRGVDCIHVGQDVAVFEGAWLQCEEGKGPLTIGDNTYLGHDVHIHADAPVTIGARCVLADGVFIASTDHLREDPAEGSSATGPISIGDKVFIGQRAVVLGDVTIGARATVAAGAVVTMDVPAGATVGGVPARIIQAAR
ncbi:MAG: acyltransferase [Nostocoides sp.]